VVSLALIELHRYRAMRMGDLDEAHASVERLARFAHRAAIPVLVEILSSPRTGFARGESGMGEADNGRSRRLALQRLGEWRTAEAQRAIRARQLDRDPAIAEEAVRLLESYPGEW
jgi:hypothetical protein